MIWKGRIINERTSQLPDGPELEPEAVVDFPFVALAAQVLPQKGCVLTPSKYLGLMRHTYHRDFSRATRYCPYRTYFTEGTEARATAI
jgi:hypothetical protein